MSATKSMMLCGATVLTLTVLFGGCTEPRGELAGCTTDEQCKGVRVCSAQGECISPLALPDDADAGDSSDAGACTDAPTARMAVSTRGSNDATAMTVAPRSRIELDASASSAAQGQIDSYEWNILDHPHASNLPHLKPALVGQGQQTASFVANTLGTYVIELTVVDDAGTPSCDSARAEVTVGTDSDIFVELVWDTPEDADQTDADGADMDLHYKHPDGEWGYEPLDIFWYNPTADWGEEDERRDDPELIRDDEDGAGPELIEHDRPEDLRYGVGIYYYEDAGYHESHATVRVYLDGVLAHEVAGESLPGTDTFYDAAIVDADDEVVEPVGVHYDGYPPEN